VIETGDGWTLNLGDCIEGMRTMGDNSVDVVITDPPYDEHTHSAGRRGHTDRAEAMSSSRATFNRTRDLGFAAITQEDMAESSRQWARLTRRWVLVFCSVEMVGDSAADHGHGWRAHLERAGLQYIRTCFWRKVGCTPQFTGDRPAQALEAIVLAHRPGRKRWNGGGKHGYYEHPIVLNRPGGKEVRVHTTQKPLPLMLELVGDFTVNGETILDSYSGAGTTGFACRQLGRRFIGWELNRDYFDIACRRLRGEEAKPNPAQPSLFGAAL
jgi:DNA modification methylase